ncbi:acyl-CoA desaturase [Bacillus sp. DNRA2]|uniref:fatty acid desaturase family protein n=1 Tax=Bacillus sp. DNRA2 TaxID=2723053 RepID=UPI00145F2B4E|nr:acyl-CoA desaturase [Bacillus sp. DNRA2]NMD69187.1 acyl-CoA desaturase [Bacillus sp. DNRA2]
MKEFQSFGWYAAQIKPHLPQEAFKPVPTRLLGGLAYLIIISVCMVSISYFDLNVWLNTLLSLVIGFCFSGIGFLGHEVLHGTVIKNARIRNVIGAICFWPFTTGPLLWRKWHNSTHHVHTQHAEKDPDTWSTAEVILKSPLLRALFRMPKLFRSISYCLFLFINFNTHSTRMFIRFIKEFKPENRRTVWVQFVFPWLFWIGLIFLIGPVKWCFVYLIPAMIGNFIVSSYIATNHNLNPQTDTNDPLANSLTVTVPKWIDVLHYQFSLHTEHHMFPSMNPKYYPLVQTYIKKMWPERYHEMTYWKAMLTLIRTPRIYLKEKHLIDFQQGKIFGSLGNGLDPDHIHYQKIGTDESIKSKISPKQST